MERRRIEVHTQKEFDELPDCFGFPVEILVVGKLDEVSPIPFPVIIRENAEVDVVWGTIREIGDNAHVGEIGCVAFVNIVSGFCRIDKMSGGAYIRYTSSTPIVIGEMEQISSIGQLGEMPSLNDRLRPTIKNMKDSSLVGYGMFGNIENVSDTATVRRFTKYLNIGNVGEDASVIEIDHNDEYRLSGGSEFITSDKSYAKFLGIECGKWYTYDVSTGKYSEVIR